MPSNPVAPHVILLAIKAEVRELLPSGEVSGNVAHRHKNGEHELLMFNCQDRDLAIRQLSEVIDRLRREGFTKR